jgi:hypothetical protein
MHIKQNSIINGEGISLKKLTFEVIWIMIWVKCFPDVKSFLISFLFNLVAS